MDWKQVGRPKAIGSRKEIILANYDKVYGPNNWRLVFDLGNGPLTTEEFLRHYEDSYYLHFLKNREELKWIADNYEDVFDNNPSNVNSGCDYKIQEFGGNHYQDIAVRNCMKRFGLKFKGKGLLEIRMNEPGKSWNPGELPFHNIDSIPKPELLGWWKPGSIESAYQSARYLETTNKRFRDDILFFVTSNEGKVKSAEKALDGKIKLEQIALDIPEELETVEKISDLKARVAYSVLCRPVICDDSGFVIPSLNNYPGLRVGRELKEKGIQHFTNLAKDGPLEAYFVQSLAYFDEALVKPRLFVSKVPGKLIGKTRGEMKPHLKSEMGRAFVIDGQDKTLAEMNELEYRLVASSERWKRFAEFFKSQQPS